MRLPASADGRARRFSTDGYVEIRSPSGKGYIREHRDIVSLALGRTLTKDEVVHHLDGNRSNNDPANLILLAKGDHSWIHGKGVCPRGYSPGKTRTIMTIDPEMLAAAQAAAAANGDTLSAWLRRVIGQALRWGPQDAPAPRQAPEGQRAWGVGPVPRIGPRGP